MLLLVKDEGTALAEQESSQFDARELSIDILDLGGTWVPNPE